MSVHFDAYNRVVTAQLEWNDDWRRQWSHVRAEACGPSRDPGVSLQRLSLASRTVGQTNKFRPDLSCFASKLPQLNSNQTLRSHDDGESASATLNV